MIEYEEFLVSILLGTILGGLLAGAISAVIQFLRPDIIINRFFCTSWLIFTTILSIMINILCT